MRTRLNSLPLFWRVFGTNAAVLVLAFLGAGLRAGHGVGAAGDDRAHRARLRASCACSRSTSCCCDRRSGRSTSSPRRCADTIRSRPASACAVDGGPDVAALAQAFNEMLDRLESERRESARRALLRAGGRAAADRARAARRGRPDADRRDAAGRGPGRRRSRTSSREQLDELRETARHGTEEVRRIARRLRPEALEDLGLQSALAALATSFGEQARRPDRPAAGATALPLSRGAGAGRLPRRAGGAHERRAPRGRRRTSSSASSAQTTHVVLTVRDDGRGLPPDALPSSHGIRGMRERAMLIGAQLTIADRRAAAPRSGSRSPLEPRHE